MLLPLSDSTASVISFLSGFSSLEATKEAVCVTSVISPSCGASSVATRHCCHLSKRSTLFLCLVPNLLGSGGVALFLFLVFLLGFFSIEFCTAPVEFCTAPIEFCTAPVKLCTAPLGFCIWLIAPPELCRCSITIFPSAANAGVAVSISVVEAAGVIDCRCCPLADLLGVLSTSLFTSLFCVVEAGDFSIDAVLILLHGSRQRLRLTGSSSLE